MTFEPSARQLWRKLSREERQAAARAFFDQPGSDVLASADAAVRDIEKLHAREPKNAEVRSLRATLYHKRAMRALVDKEPAFDGVIRDLVEEP